MHFLILLWKFIIIDLTAVALEGATLRTHSVWRSAWFRLRSKVMAKSETLKARVRRARSRGKEPPDVSGTSKIIDPIAKFSETGEIVWNEDLVKEIEKLGENPSPQAGQRGRGRAPDPRPNRGGR